MKHFLLVLAAIFIASCNSKPTHSTTAYFGGEIINPNSEYVLLYKNDEVIDTAYLDKNNRFLVEIDKPTGLYYFTHKPEEQYVFIEEGDSILMRLNTLEFDESLIFSGRGAEVNNFLLEMFLLNEDEERIVYKYNKLPPKQFLYKLDSLRKMKHQQLQALIKENNISPEAIHVAKASIDFINFQQREWYPYVRKRLLYEEDLISLPKEFYAYRDTLNLNDHTLSFYNPYFKFCIYHFNNITYIDCAKNCNDNINVEKRALHYSLHKLHLIDSIVKEPNLRYILFRNTAYSYLFDDHSPKNNEHFINTFKILSKDKRHQKEVFSIYKNIQSLLPGKLFPEDITFTNINGEEKTVANFSKKHKKVFYFWSLNQKGHMKNVFKRVHKLSKKYPDYEFIGINFTDNRNRWLATLQQYKLDTLTQFQGDEYLSKKLVFSDQNKAIILKNDGIIVDAFANIFSKSLEKHLKH
jgi:hypothetical protein